MMRKDRRRLQLMVVLILGLQMMACAVESKATELDTDDEALLNLCQEDNYPSCEELWNDTRTAYIRSATSVLLAYPELSGTPRDKIDALLDAFDNDRVGDGETDTWSILASLWDLYGAEFSDNFADPMQQPWTVEKSTHNSGWPFCSSKRVYHFEEGSEGTYNNIELVQINYQRADYQVLECPKDM
ncbi:MAG: hypothetical protein IPJ88_03370 [Myxococcales bacterium]|nr:MAG: hypothetical protein IPJ88_03370 [Myxococcales bacterium]